MSKQKISPDWHPVEQGILTEAEYGDLGTRDQIQLCWECCDDAEFKETLRSYLWDVYHIVAEDEKHG